MLEQLTKKFVNLELSSSLGETVNKEINAVHSNQNVTQNEKSLLAFIKHNSDIPVTGTAYNNNL
jgi:hypothetical protein